jgi:nucleoid-associated protein YgaU
LAQTVRDCNALACELFVENHSNAGAIEQKAGDGGAEGTEVFYHHQGGIKSNSYKIAFLIYKHIAPLSLGKDRGIKPDSAYSGGSLYVIQNTNPPACLVESIFHTNYAEVADMLAHIDKYAKAEAQAICEYCDEVWMEPIVQTDPTYTVVKGDRLWAIAAKFLGDGNRYPEIKKLNNLASDVLTPGQVLKIPKK